MEFKNFNFSKFFVYYFIINEAVKCGENETPSFIEPVPNVTVTVGKDAALPCRVGNLGQYKISWVHVDKQVTIAIHTHILPLSHRYRVTHDNLGTWLLHIKEVRREDSGYYMCQINTRPIMNRVGYLQVVVPPFFIEDNSTTSVTSINTTEGHDLSLKCKAGGVPEPTIGWRREDGQDIQSDKTTKATFVNGEELLMQKITRADTAVYSCVASNRAHPSISKRIFVNVRFPPMVIVSNQLISVAVGSNVTLTCQIEANPPAVTHWSFKQRPKLNNAISGKYSLSNTANSYRSSSKLTIKTVDKRDFGPYSCISKNTLGRTEGTIILYELIPPKTTTLRTISSHTTQKKPLYSIDHIDENWFQSKNNTFKNQNGNHGFKLQKNGCIKVGYETVGILHCLISVFLALHFFRT